MIGAEAFEDAYVSMGRKLISWLCRNGLSLDLAEDIAQEAWLKAWNTRDQFRGGCSFSTWMFMIARNARLNSLLTHRRAKSGEYLRKNKEFQLLACAENIRPHVEDFDTRIHAHQVLARCRPAAATLLRKYYLEEDCVPPGRSVGAFRVRLHEARLTARKAMESIQ